MSARKFAVGSDMATTGLTLKEELDIINKFDAVLAIQKEEYISLLNYGVKTLVLLCPHAVQGKAVPAPRHGIHFGYIGSASPINIEALKWFLKNIWPLLPEKISCLHVFGSICQRLDKLPDNVICHGVVSQMEEAYSRCNVMINPAIRGSGLKIKTIEAIAMGRPIIASPEAAAGIDDPYACGILLASGRSEFVWSMLRLIYDRSLREELASNAANSLKRHFSTKAAYGSLISFIGSY